MRKLPAAGTSLGPSRGWRPQRPTIPRTTWPLLAMRLLAMPLLATLLLVSAGPWSVRLAAAEPLAESKWRREIYVPFDELNLLLEGQNQRVFLTREQYDALLAKASPAERVIPPWEATVLSAEYDVSVESDRAVFRGELVVEGLRDGLHAVPLQLGGVGLRAASVDGQPAKLARDERGQVQLLLDRLGRQTVLLELVAPLATTAAQQSLTFQVPTPSAARLRITVPGNVEVRSGASVLRREVDEQAGVTRLELLPQPGEIALRLSLNNRLLRRRQVVVARSVLVGEVTAGYERLHASLSLDVLQGAVEQFRFRVPAEFEITEVSSPLVSRWNVLPGDDGAVLEVALREAVEGSLLLNVAALRTTPRTERWSFPRLEPLDVAGQVAVVGLLVEDRFEVEGVTSRELIAIGTDVLTEALPDTIFEAEPGAPRIRPVAAFYAAQADFGLDAQLNRPAPAFDARINLLLTLDNQRHQLRGGILVQPRVEQLLRFDFQLPAAWNVTQVQAAGGEALPIERFSTDQGDTRVQVRLPAAIAPGDQFEVVFTAESTPAGWLAAWRDQPVQFPLVRLPDARQVGGALAVQPTDDLSLRPLQLDGLAPLDENEKPKYGLQGVASQLAYRFETPQYAASFQASRDQAWVTAQTYAFYRLAPNNLSVHYELAFDVQRARVDELAFWLPAGTPPAVTIRALDGVELKEFNSQVDEGRRRWTVGLAERRSGVLRLAVDFRQRIAEDEPRGLALPPVQADGVAYQTALVAVEGSAELDINVRTPGRRVDVGELYNAEYQVGRRLLGAFAFLGETADVQVDVFRRPGYQLPPAIVQRAEMVTLVAPGGRSQTAARFQLRTKAPYLELHLPAGTLWSVFLDGKGIAPQLDGDRILISLPASSADQLRDLQVVYESSEQPMVATEVDVQGPRLFLRTDAGQTDREVPLADLVWHLYLSEGLTVTETGGSVSPVQPLVAPRPALKLLWAMRNGLREIGPWILRPARQFAREAKQALPSPYYLADDIQMAQTEPAAATAESGAMGGIGGGGFGLQGEPEAAFERSSRFAPATPPGAGPMANEPPADMPAPTQAPPAEGTTRADAGRGPGGIAPTAPPPAEVAQDPGAPDGADRPGQGGQQGQGQVQRSQAAFWALEGVRSLDIQLTTDMAGRQHRFQSLGAEPRLTARFVDFRRIELPVWSVLALVLLLGVGITGRSVLFKARYLLLVAVLALVLPLATPWTIALAPSSEAALVAVGLLVPYYLLAGFVWLCYRGLRATGRRLPQPTAAGLLAVACVLSGLGGDRLFAQQHSAAPEVMRADQLIESWLSVLRPPAPLIIPADAVVVPYDASAGLAGIQQAQKLLVPYDRYVELWNLAYPDQKLELPPPLPYAVSSATYEARLEGNEFLLVRGRIVLDLFVDRPVGIPLALRGGALTSATLDGQPARLQVIAPAPPGQQPAEQPPGPAMQPMQGPAQQAAIASPQPDAAAPGAAEGLLVLYTSGRGRRQLELSARFRLERQGGWRVAAGHVPLAAATSLDLTVPEPRTDVRLSGVVDRQRYETQEAGELLRTSLASGEFGIQWRPRIAEGQVDQNLTARSDAVLEVQEDGLRLRWNVRLEFRRDRRETFTLSVPAGYLVERVEGENVRGWQAEPRDERQQLEITLLKPAAESESLTVELTQRAAIGAEPRALRVPAVEVAGAVLHQGQLLIRRSPLLELRTLAVNGATRTDATATPLAQSREESPLGLTDFQAFRFAATPFEIELQSSPVETNVAARWQSILRIAPRELQLESRLNLRVRNRPLYKLELSLPAELRLDQVGLPDNSEWSERIVDGRKRLTVLLKSGVLGDVALLLTGRLDRAAGQEIVDLPQLAVLDVSPQQGDFAVQIDPAFDVVPRQLDGCQSVLPGQVHAWLNESQRAATQLALRWDRPGYSGQLQVRARQPRATVLAVANVRVTERTIEETLLLDFTIRDAGIRQIQFLLPDWMRDARIDVPLLRQKTIEPVEGAGRPLPHAAMVRVRLELQDELIGQLRVLIQNDRLLSDQVQSVPLVVVETGTTEQRFVTLESAGRDEVLVSQLEGLEELTREQQDWRRLAGLLGDKLTRAYLVRGDAQRPGLEFQTKTRRAVETPTARIGLGTTLLMVDAYGAYRGEQTYRVENATEQFLEIELPVGTELWTVHVAGEPVKPTVVPGGNSDRLVRVPIIKTDVGDDDYPVTLKYGGRMTGLGTLTQVAFPLLRTRNITVELSQVSLRLPDEYRWFNFGGSMRRVLDQAELQAGYFEYKTRQIQNWSEALSSSNPFTRARASSNLKQLGVTLHSMYDDSYSLDASDTLRKKAAESLAALEQAEARLEVTESRESVTMPLDNRSQLNYLWNEQSNQRATNVVTQLGGNFDQTVLSVAPQPADDTRFNRRWLDQNALRNPMADKEATAGERISGKAQAQLPASKPSVSSSSQLLGLEDQKQLAQQEEFDRSEMEERSKYRDQTTQALERYRQQLDEQQALRIQRGAEQFQPQSHAAQARQPAGAPGTDEALVPTAGSGFEGRPSAGYSGQQPDGLVANAPGLSTRGELAGAALPAGELSDAEAHLASLDLQLAQRGTLFNFTARDQIQIEAQMVPSDLANRAVRLFGIGVAAIMLGLVLRWLGRRRG